LVQNIAENRDCDLWQEEWTPHAEVTTYMTGDEKDESDLSDVLRLRTCSVENQCCSLKVA
jgi:hypothetical protein